MIEDVANPEVLLQGGNAAYFKAAVNGPDGVIRAFRIRTGQFVLKNHVYLPVIDGKTSINVFGRLRADRHHALLATDVSQPDGEIADALFVASSHNYYHFLMTELPMLLFIKTQTEAAVHVALANAFPSSMETFVPDLARVLAKGRDVAFSRLKDGVYALKNVVMPTRQDSFLGPYVARKVVIPYVFQRHGISDPLQQFGPVKIFVKRTHGTGGRNLVNQDEVEAFFVKRGYIAVDPGALRFEEQVVLFARATHIVGVEGAAMANMLFAVNAQKVTLISSPAVADEHFFPGIAKHYDYAFAVIPGVMDAAGGEARRVDDYRINLDLLDAAGLVGKF